MRQGTNKNRARGRGNNGRKNVPLRLQTFDSHGPEARIRGNAYQLHEKYLALARDASASGDRVTAENYLQHAEHYYRIIHASEQEQSQYNGHGGRPGRGGDPFGPTGFDEDSDENGDEATADGGQETGAGPQAQQSGAQRGGRGRSNGRANGHGSGDHRPRGDSSEALETRGGSDDAGPSRIDAPAETPAVPAAAEDASAPPAASEAVPEAAPQAAPAGDAAETPRPRRARGESGGRGRSRRPRVEPAAEAGSEPEPEPEPEQA